MAKEGCSILMVLASTAIVGLMMARAAGAQMMSVSPSPVPSSSVNCSGALASAANCLGYVSEGSNLTSPGSACCSSIEDLITSSPVCLCQLIVQSGSLGLPVDRKRALAIPNACKLSAPPLSACSLLGVPIPGPSEAPLPAASGRKAPMISETPPSPSPFSASPSPSTAGGGGGSPDCIAAYMSAFSCLDYIITGSNKTSPTSDCCSGISNLITNEPICLCQLQGASTPLGIAIDRKRALGLPGVCKIKSFPLSYCSKMGYSAPVPARAPSPSPAAGGGFETPASPSPSPAAGGGFETPASPSPSPEAGGGGGSPDCNAAYMNAISCLDYITTGSNETSPTSDCCSGISKLITDEPVCLCQLLDASPSSGISIDRKRALGLPGACKVKPLPLSYCSKLGHPAPAPAVASSSPADAASTPAPGESEGATGASPRKGDGVRRFGFIPSVLLSTAIATIAIF